MKLVWLILLLVLLGTTPAGSQSSYEFNDPHFHLTNNIQDGPDIHDFLQHMMNRKVGRTVLAGIPLQQLWSYRVDGNRAPTYYLHSDSPLYYYSFTDAWIATAYKSLSKEQQARFDPMITGFNPSDMYAADHIRRVLQTFPGVFTGIGEFTAETGLVVLIHNEVFYQYDPLWKLLYEQTIRKLRLTNYERIFDEGRRKVRSWERTHQFN